MKTQLAKGVLWLSAAKVLVNTLALCSTFVLARLLTPEDFGLVALAVTMLEVLSAVTELSLAASLIHHARPTEAHFHTAWTLNALRAMLIGGAFAAASPWVASAYHDDRLVPVMCWMGLSVCMQGFTNPKVVTLTRQLVFWQEFVVLVSQKLAGVIVSITVAVVFRTYWALVAGVVFTQVAGVIASYIVVRYRPRWSLAHVRDLLSFSVWLSLGQLVNTLNWRLDHLIIGARMGPRMLGLYTVGDNLAALPTREVIMPIEQALFPGLRAMTHDPDRLRRNYLRAQALIAAAALPVGTLFAFQADVIVRIVLGEKWAASATVMQMLALVFALQTVSSPVRPLAMAQGQTRLLFMRDLMMFGLRVPLIAAAAWWGGLTLVLQARILSGGLAIAMNMAMVKKLCGATLTQQALSAGRSVVSAAAAALLLWALHALLDPTAPWWDQVGTLVVHSGTAVLVYVATHLLLWRVAGRPGGPEADALSLLNQLRHRFSPTPEAHP